MAERQIAYLWAPYFGAAVARAAAPWLRAAAMADRPLVLLDEHGRVLAADEAAARAGVVPGLSDQQAAAHCPGAQLAPAGRFPLWEAQQRFLDCVKPYTDRWQPDGLGRVYLDATAVAPAAPARVEGELLQWCQALVAAVRGLGWQPALGATGSKFGASVAGQVASRNATMLLIPAAQRVFLAEQPASLLPLDADALLQLRHLGIRTLGQYTRLPATGVLTRFGPVGRTAQRWAQGLDDRPVLPPWESAEVSSRIEFEPPLADRERLLAALLARADRLLAPLRDRLQDAARVSLNVTRGDGRVIPVSHTFPLPTVALSTVRHALASLLERVTWHGEGAAEIVVTLAGITDAPSPQLTLFDLDGADDGNRARLTAILERLAARFGADAFRLATLADPDHLLLERRAAFQPWPTPSPPGSM